MSDHVVDAIPAGVGCPHCQHWLAEIAELRSALTVMEEQWQRSEEELGQVLKLWRASEALLDQEF